jgi:hypothetical protein
MPQLLLDVNSNFGRAGRVQVRCWIRFLESALKRKDLVRFVLHFFTFAAHVGCQKGRSQ